jgi:hypothetical protein
MKRVFAFRRRQRARSVLRRIVTIFGYYDALDEVRSRRQAKLLLRQFMR